MAEPFTLESWQTQTAAWWREAARDLPGTMQRLGVRTAAGRARLRPQRMLRHPLHRHRAHRNDPSEGQAAKGAKRLGRRCTRPRAIPLTRLKAGTASLARLRSR